MFLQLLYLQFPYIFIFNNIFLKRLSIKGLYSSTAVFQSFTPTAEPTQSKHSVIEGLMISSLIMNLVDDAILCCWQHRIIAWDVWLIIDGEEVLIQSGS